MEVNRGDKIEVVLRNEEEHSSENTISLLEIIDTIIRKKWVIIITIIAFFISSIGVLYFISPYSTRARTMVSFNFEGIEKGLDPKGRKFNVDSIKGINVLSKVVTELSLTEKYGITADNLRNSIELEPVIPGNITAKIKRLEEAKTENIKDLKEFVFYPNTFIVDLNIQKGANVDSTTARKILDDVINKYTEDFYLKYTDRELLGTALGTLNYEEYDYPEVSRIVHSQINIMSNYLKAKKEEKNGAAFRSKATAFSFNDIISSIEVIADVDVTRMDSIIGAFNLTKDKNKLIKLYEYRIKTLEVTKAKKDDESRIVDGVIGKYQKDKSLVLMGGVTSTESFEFEQKDDYYNDLAQRYTDTGVQATDAVHDIQFYIKEIERFNNDIVPTDIKKIAQKDVTDLMGTIKGKLEKWIKISDQTIKDYYEVEIYNNSLKQLTPAENQPTIENLKIILGVVLLLGLMIGVFIAFIGDYWKKGRAIPTIK